MRLKTIKELDYQKKDFSLIQKHIENFKNQKYKELSKSTLYQNKKDLSKEKQKEQEIKQRRSQKTIKDEIRKNLEETFFKATSKTYFNNHMKSLNYEVYKRGNTLGIKYKNKNYRLKTLGLEKEYLSMFKKFEHIQEREVRRQKTKNYKSHSNEQSRSR